MFSITPLEKEVLTNLYTNKLKDTKSIQDVVLFLSKDDNKLSESQVKLGRQLQRILEQEEPDRERD